MKSRDSEILEQFLRTMAPPAALTATYRQRVVRASLKARSKIEARRQLRRMLAGALLLGCFLMAPAGMMSVARHVWSGVHDEVALGAEDAGDADRALPKIGTAVDGYELSVIRAQLQSRLGFWAALQKP
jgi:hypothetical protein